MFPYILKGLQVGEFKGARKYTLKSNFQCRVLKQHPYRRYLKGLEQLQFTNPHQTQSKTFIHNFKEFMQANDRAGNDDVWAECVCSVNTIGLNATHFYVGCPHCRKKVLDTENSTCVHCNQDYNAAKCRYILSINMVDSYDAMWVSCYDEVAEQIL